MSGGVSIPCQHAYINGKCNGGLTDFAGLQQTRLSMQTGTLPLSGRSAVFDSPQSPIIDVVYVVTRRPHQKTITIQWDSIGLAYGNSQV